MSTVLALFFDRNRPHFKNFVAICHIVVEKKELIFAVKRSRIVDSAYAGALHGREIKSDNGRLKFTLEGNSAEIWIPA